MLRYEQQEILVRSTIFVLMLGVLAAAPPADAQTTGQLQVGARVRFVALEGKRTTGTPAGLTADSILLAGSGHAVVYGGGALGLLSGAIVGSMVKNERWVGASRLDTRTAQK